MSKRPRSACWDYFEKNDEYGTCLVGDCSVNVKHCGNTSNFLKHLNSCHPEEYQACIAAQNRNKRPKTSTSSRQITLPETISQSRKYLKNSLRCKQLDDALFYMITTDLQPISIVEIKVFGSLQHSLTHAISLLADVPSPVVCY